MDEIKKICSFLLKKSEENSKEKVNSGSLREVLDTLVSFADKRCKK